MAENVQVDDNEYKNGYNQFITALDMAQLKKVAAGIRRIDFNKPKSSYMKMYDDFLNIDLPEIKKNVKMTWVHDVIDSRVDSLSRFISNNWSLPKDLSKEFEKNADYIDKLSNVWHR